MPTPTGYILCKKMKKKRNRDCFRERNIPYTCSRAKLSQRQSLDVNKTTEEAMLHTFRDTYDIDRVCPDITCVTSDENSCDLCDSQLSTASNQSISDSSCSSFLLEEITGFDDIIHSDLCSDNRWTYPSLSLDMDEHRILYSLEEDDDANIFHDQKLIEGSLMNFDDDCVYVETRNVKPLYPEIINRLDKDVENSFDPDRFLWNIPTLLENIPSQPTTMGETEKKKLVTLVLDLDETLVHSTLEHCENVDFTFPVFYEMKEQTVYVRQRPYLHMFLEKVSKMFQIVIFTASQSIYAEKLLDILDPDKRLISQRIYREACIFLNDCHLKDLTVLGLDLAKVAIIDNSPQVFQLQVNNGIPIQSWFDDPSDCALLSLLPFLETLVDAEDVRPLIANKFSNSV